MNREENLKSRTLLSGSVENEIDVHVIAVGNDFIFTPT
jgi:hypothetical protein